MKKGKIGLVVIIIFIVYYSFFSTSAAVRYHNRLLGYQASVVKKLETFFDRITSDLQEGVVPTYNKLKEQVNRAITKVENTADFKGYSRLREVILSGLKFYKSYIEKDCKHLMDLVYLENEKTISEDDRQQVDLIRESYDSQFDAFKSRYDAVRLEFMERFKIKPKGLKKNKMYE